MGIYKRGEVYWYKFIGQGRTVRESTKQGNDKVARQMEAAHRTSLAKGEVGIREKKRAPYMDQGRTTALHPTMMRNYEDINLANLVGRAH